MSHIYGGKKFHFISKVAVYGGKSKNVVESGEKWYHVGKCGERWGNFYLASGLVRSYVEVKQYGYMVEVLEF